MASKAVFLLLAVVVVVAGVNAQGGRRGWQGDRQREHEGKGEGVFPPEGGGGSSGGRSWDYPPGGGRGYGGGGGGGDRQREHEGKGEGVFPPEGGRGSGSGGRSWDYPPEGGRGYHGGGSGGPGGRGRVPMDSRRYILSDSKRVVVTDAGGMKVVKGVGGLFSQSPMHIGFITMEPNSMFIPQYLDSSLILFLEIGEARIGSIYKDEFVEQDLKAGDLYRIQAGSVFYLVNKAQGQRLRIITSIDTAESSDWHAFQTFFIGGGTSPTSVLAGFDTQTLATAFNVTYDVIDELLSTRQEGAIVYLNPDGTEPQREPSMWRRFLEQGTKERKTQMKRIIIARQKPDKIEEKTTWTWSVSEFLSSIFGNKKGSSGDNLDSYNIYDRKADFRNDYGWSVEVNGDDYEPLKMSDFGVYLVNLTAGSMMAPHINPTATEYGVVLSGTGNIQVVFPNGTLAMDAEVNEGDVFWIPRYFPFCQVASRTSPFVFFGFSTSAHSNLPQFLVGQGSILQTMLNPEFAAAFGLSEDRMGEIINAQRETVILPSTSASPGGGDAEIPEDESGEDESGDQPQGQGKGGEGSMLMKKMGSKIRMKKSSFAYNMAMGLD